MNELKIKIPLNRGFGLSKEKLKYVFNDLYNGLIDEKITEEDIDIDLVSKEISVKKEVNVNPTDDEHKAKLDIIRLMNSYEVVISNYQPSNWRWNKAIDWPRTYNSEDIKEYYKNLSNTTITEKKNEFDEMRLLLNDIWKDEYEYYKKKYPKTWKQKLKEVLINCARKLD